MEYSGQAGPLTLNACEAACTPIPVKTYPGTAENLGATSVTLSPDAPTVVEGETTALTATAAPAGPSYTVAWKSLDPSVATVNASGVVTGVAAGTAKIEAAVASKADTVTVTVTTANTCVETTYTIGSTADASWTAGDCLAASGSGRRFDMYAVTLTQQTAFTVQLTGPAGRRINVRRAGTQDYVQVMASDAFMPAASNPLQVGYVLPAGSYVMEVANPDAATLGAYSLATTTTLPAGCSTLVFTWPGVTINGALANTDCTRPDGTGREDRYIVLPDAGVRLSMGMTSTAFPVSLNFLDVQTATPVMLAYDRQADLGEPAKVAFTTTFAGFHNVVVSHNSADATGNYSLTVGTESAANTCAAIETDISSRMAKWESTDCAEDGRLYDKYTFTSDEQEAFKVTLTSASGVKSAGLFKDGVEVLDWVRTPAGDLTAAWVVPAGSYEFRVGAPSASAGTTYSWTSQNVTQVECISNGAAGGVTLPSQTLGGADCVFTGTGAYEDRLYMFVAAGKTIEVTMEGVSVPPRAIIRDPASPDGTVLSMETSATNGTVTASYTTTVAGYYQVIFSSNAGGQTGTYNGTIVVR